VKNPEERVTSRRRAWNKKSESQPRLVFKREVSGMPSGVGGLARKRP